MKVFIGKAQNWQNEVRNLYTTFPLEPFSEVVVNFLEELSKKLLKNSGLRKYPELVALGYWLRKSNIKTLQNEFFRRTNGKVVKPRGVVLHFAPSNVDTIFVYSWVLSLLIGNKNIIRISQNENEPLHKLVAIINECLNKDQYLPIKERLFVCSYEHNDQMTEFLSNYCQTRVIWGGDQTVRTIKQIPLNPLATELVFADRFSLVALSASAILEIPEEDFSRLVNNFYNDVFTFDQLACSSPRLVVWTGVEEQVLKAKNKFWDRLDNLIKEKSYNVAPALNVSRLSTTFYLAAQQYTTNVPSLFQREVKRVEVNEFNDEIRKIHCGAGLFIEWTVLSLNEVASSLSDKDQTLSYFGYEKEELVQFLHCIQNRAIDRIVPVGQALNFSQIWDGYDLLLSFTREIEIL